LLSDAEERLILVDEDDVALSSAGKLDAHRTGDLHRAFSIFLFRANGDLLIQRRAACKYHSPGLWANTCCGHPRPDEDTLLAGRRRLGEELGIDCALQPGFQTRYRAELGNGLVENELVHILFAVSDAPARCHPDEASDVKGISLEALGADIKASPETYAVWIVRYFDRHAEALARHRDDILARHHQGQRHPATP